LFSECAVPLFSVQNIESIEVYAVREDEVKEMKERLAELGWLKGLRSELIIGKRVFTPMPLKDTSRVADVELLHSGATLFVLIVEKVDIVVRLPNGQSVQMSTKTDESGLRVVAAAVAVLHLKCGVNDVRFLLNNRVLRTTFGLKSGTVVHAVRVEPRSAPLHLRWNREGKAAESFTCPADVLTVPDLIDAIKKAAGTPIPGKPGFLRQIEVTKVTYAEHLLYQKGMDEEQYRERLSDFGITPGAAIDFEANELPVPETFKVIIKPVDGEGFTVTTSFDATIDKLIWAIVDQERIPFHKIRLIYNNRLIMDSPIVVRTVADYGVVPGCTIHLRGPFLG